MNNNFTFTPVPMGVLLVVEDSNEDFETLQRLLKRSPQPIPIRRCFNGDQALTFLTSKETCSDLQHLPYPSLILLDLNLPGTDGREVLRQIKQHHTFKSIPVVVFTTSNNPKDVETCYQYGVDKYVVKSFDFSQLKRDIQTIIDYWLEVTKA